MKEVKDVELAELEIQENMRVVDYNTKEYPIETIVQKYLEGIENDENELFIPDYQREFTWDEKRQSRFIESVLIGLPIPFIFVADVGSEEARLEIVDGSQRIRTLAAFINNNLVLRGLDKLRSLDGFTFQDLPISRQRRFKRHSLRMIELTEKADEEVRRDLFERINTGSDILKSMEVRWGASSNDEFLKFIRACAENELFRELAPLPKPSVVRRGYDELVLRFFAYLNSYQTFKHEVAEFLDEYLASLQGSFDSKMKDDMASEFQRMLEFVRRNFENGFAKGPGLKKTPRIRFEAISVGVALALRENSNIVTRETSCWVNSKEFILLTTSGASNSRPKLVSRIEFVKKKVLG